MTTVEIPLLADPQTLTVDLNGVSYQLGLRWNVPAACWVLDIADAAGGAVLQGAPLITGADLLAQYEYLGIDGQLIVQSDFDNDAVPTFDNLGVLGHLYYVT